MNLDKPLHVVEAGQGIAGQTSDFTYEVYFFVSFFFFVICSFLAIEYLYRRLKRTRPDLWRRVFGYDGKNPDTLPRTKIMERIFYSGWRDITALLERQDDEMAKYAFAAWKCSVVFSYVTLFLLVFRSAFIMLVVQIVDGM